MGKRTPMYTDPCHAFLYSLDKSLLVDCVIDLLRPLGKSVDHEVSRESAIARLQPILQLPTEKPVKATWSQSRIVDRLIELGWTVSVEMVARAMSIRATHPKHENPIAGIISTHGKHSLQIAGVLLPPEYLQLGRPAYLTQ